MEDIVKIAAIASKKWGRHIGMLDYPDHINNCIVKFLECPRLQTAPPPVVATAFRNTILDDIDKERLRTGTKPQWNNNKKKQFVSLMCQATGCDNNTRHTYKHACPLYKIYNECLNKE